MKFFRLIFFLFQKRVDLVGMLEFENLYSEQPLTQIKAERIVGTNEQ